MIVSTKSDGNYKMEHSTLVFSAINFGKDQEALGVVQ